MLVIDRYETVLARLADHAHAVFSGDANNGQLIERAGVGNAGSVRLGEGVRLLTVGGPTALGARPPRDSGIGSRTGMSVIAVRRGEEYTSTLMDETVPPPDGELLMLGSLHQRRSFGASFDSHRSQ